MNARRKFALVALLVCSAALIVFAEKISDIKPQGFVTDLAGVIGANTRNQLETLCAEVQQKTGAQIAVVTVKSLDGRTREDYAADLFKSLGIGAKKTDKGVLLLVAPNDRQYKIEVGYGLEPAITDAQAGDIGRDMVPYLKSGDYNRAVLTGTTQIAQLIAQSSGVQLNGIPNARPRAPTKSLPWWVPLAIFGGFFLLIRALARRGGGGRRGPPGIGGGGSMLPWMILGSGMGRGGSWGGGFGGSSGGWGGGGGGGFGGFGGFGGGMSGGGGAGGSW